MKLYYKTSNLKNIRNLYIDGFILTYEDNEATLMGDYTESTDSSGRWKGLYIEGVPDVLNENQGSLYQNIKTLLEAGYKVTNCIFAGNYDDDEDISFNIDGIELVVGNKFEEKRLYLLANPITIQNH